MIATGAEYRKPRCENLSRLEGAGVYYAATFVEAQLCGGDEVIVVGGGNSAGQAACVSGGDYKASAHAREVCRFGQDHVELLDSPNRRDSQHSSSTIHGDHGAPRRRSLRISYVAK